MSITIATDGMIRPFDAESENVYKLPLKAKVRRVPKVRGRVRVVRVKGRVRVCN